MSKVKNLINEMKKSDEGFEQRYIKEKTKLDIALAVFELRESLNLSQVEFAKKVGVPQSTISRIEQGQTSPTINFLLNMSTKLDKKLKIEFVNN